MVNGIELLFLHQSQQMGEFHRDDTTGLKQYFHTRNKIVQVRNMREDIIADQQIRLWELLYQFVCQRLSKKPTDRFYTTLNRHFGNICSGLNTQAGDVLFYKVLEQITVVAGDLHHQRIRSQTKTIQH